MQQKRGAKADHSHCEQTGIEAGNEEKPFTLDFGWYTGTSPNTHQTPLGVPSGTWGVCWGGGGRELGGYKIHPHRI